ncbi:MAG: hypothetical protein EHM35_13610 [Planctomycetaceae bacterium]|nr:MAG: hypothetical protein EHM35_13610 [Planctomycetaceae bacterium]
MEKHLKEVEVNMELDRRFPYGYRCEVPPVCTAYWNADDWEKWILAHGTIGTKDAPQIVGGESTVSE